MAKTKKREKRSPSPLPFGGSTVLRLTRGPAGNRTTTGRLSAPSRTTPYQLSHEDTLVSKTIEGFSSVSRFRFGGSFSSGSCSSEWGFFWVGISLLGIAGLQTKSKFWNRCLLVCGTSACAALHGGRIRSMTRLQCSPQKVYRLLHRDLSFGQAIGVVGCF